MRLLGYVSICLRSDLVLGVEDILNLDVGRLPVKSGLSYRRIGGVQIVPDWTVLGFHRS